MFYDIINSHKLNCGNEEKQILLFAFSNKQCKFSCLALRPENVLFLGSKWHFLTALKKTYHEEVCIYTIIEFPTRIF